MSIRGNAIVGQSGGPTSVINQSLVGIIEEVQKCGHIDELFGTRHGVRGVINDQLIPLKNIDRGLLSRIANTPAAALGSTRDKPDHEYCERIFRQFEKNNIQYFFYIGGNDSADTARIVSELARKEGHPLQVFHIPKTIDNDLRVHDHTPGFGSAAKFVACAMMGDNFDNKSLPGIKVDIIMGRHAGYLTAASVFARLHDEDGPHLIYVPEVPLSEDKLLGDVDRVYRKYGRCLIACSEGVVTPDGKTWLEKLGEDMGRDSHGNIQLSGTGALGDAMADMFKAKLSGKLRIRADTFGYLQRSFPGLISETDAREARLVAQMAVRYSRHEAAEGSVAMRRVSNNPYKIEIFLAPLHTVAKETKHMDASFIVDGNNIADAFKDYARPLIGPLPQVGTLDDIAELVAV